MLSRAHKTKYNKRMFESRKIIFNSGIFEQLTEKISQKIIEQIKFKNQQIKILDAGCGEGSHLSAIKKRLFQKTSNDLLGAGVDISKEGIAMASKEYPNNLWCVADIAKFPFDGKQFDFILNILSPSNYSEFQRILSDDGIIIKVIPESNHLQELRQIFYEGTDRQVYTNYNTVELFNNNLEIMDIQRVQYRAAVDNTLIEHWVYMTPLSWRTTEKHLQKVIRMSLKSITIDLTILYGKKWICK